MCKQLLVQVLGSLTAEFKVLLTGTPFQGTTEQLKALLHFTAAKGCNDADAAVKADAAVEAAKAAAADQKVLHLFFARHAAHAEQPSIMLPAEATRVPMEALHLTRSADRLKLCSSRCLRHTASQC